MPETKKDSAKDPLLEKIMTKDRPFSLSILSGVFKLMFSIYDAIVYLPFKFFANPETKKALSKRIKAQPTIPNDPSSPWRNIKAIDKPLISLVFDDCPTLGLVWDRSVKLNSNINCMGWRDVIEIHHDIQPDGRKFQKLVLDEYRWLTYKQIDEQITKIQNGLKEIGILPGDKIVLYSETRKEWMMTALACFKSGIPIVTVYATLGEDAVSFAMNECDAVAVVTVKDFLPKVLKIAQQIPKMKKVVYFYDLHQNPEVKKEADESVVQHFKENNVDLYSLEEVMEIGDSVEVDAVTNPNVKPDDLALIMYTSGTTGNPKGVMLSHKNMIATAAGHISEVEFDSDHVVIAYLPLAHIYELGVEIACLSKGCPLGYSSAGTLYDGAPKIKKGASGDCTALKPSMIAVVPAIMDRVFKNVFQEIQKSSPISQEIFRICYERSQKRMSEGYESLLMKKLVFKKISKMLGGNLRVIFSGGAPLNAETQRFMEICFCHVRQGYGMTETCGAACVADIHDLSAGTVGPPIATCEIMLREWKEANYSPHNERPQGEILIHAAHVAQGYYKNEEKTKEDFITIDGKRWFATGDIGEFRPDGALCIIDRKKDLVKLAHGEYIALGKVESALMTHSIIDNICVYGNSQKDYLIALIVPTKKICDLATQYNITNNDWQELCRNKTIQKIVVKELENFAKGKLQKVEIPKKIYICSEPWTPQNDMLTEALKLKRRKIQEAFKKEIEQMYN